MANDVATQILQLATEQYKVEQQKESAHRSFVLHIMRPGARATAYVASCVLAYDSKGRMKFSHVIHQQRRWIAYTKAVVLCDAAAQTYALQAFLSQLEQVAQSRGLIAPVSSHRRQRRFGCKLVLQCKADSTNIATKICRQSSWAALCKDVLAMVDFARNVRCV